MIKNSEDANKYYKVVNEYIDDYLENWKINPVNLKKYLNKERLSRFIERKGLKEISNIDIIINDVIDDRVSIEKDKVMKFESYLISESSEFKIEEISKCVEVGIGKSNISHEKKLADFFDVSLSQIDIVNSDNHQFRILGDEYIIYTEEELKIISENLKIYSVGKVLNRNISIEVGGISIKLETNSIINEKELESTIESSISSKINEMLNGILDCKGNKDSIEYYIGIL